MKTDIILLTGKNFEYLTLSPKKLNKFARVGDGQNYITMADLKKWNHFKIAIICAHGFLINEKADILPDEPKLFCMDLIGDKILGSDQISLLQTVLNIRHFYLFSCYGGALPLSLHKLKKNTTFTIFSSGKYPGLILLAEAMVRKIHTFYKQYRGISSKKIERDFFIKYALFAPWPTVRCEITEQDGKKKLTAFKVQAPKQVQDIDNYAHYIYSENKLKPIIVEDEKVFRTWLQEGKQKHPVNLNLYRDYSIIEAAHRGKFERVAAWIKNGANINFDITTSGINLSAPCVSERGDNAIAQLLIEQKAQIEYRSNCVVTSLHIASQAGHHKVVKTLIEAGANIETTTELGFRPLHIACQQGHIATAKMLIQKGATIDAESNDGCTPLYIVCYDGHKEIAQLLIQAGATIDYPSKDGNTPFYVACQEGHHKVVQTLIEAGANIETLYKGFRPLHIACQEGHHKVVQTLIEAGTNIETLYKGFRPLHIACQEGHHKVVQTLIEAGANIETLYNGFRPLHIACQNGHTKTVKILIQKGALIDAESNEKNTPLHLASLDGRLDIVELLIELKANIHHQSNEGHTALYLACQQGHKEIAHMLIEAGAGSSNRISK